MFKEYIWTILYYISKCRVRAGELYFFIHGGGSLFREMRNGKVSFLFLPTSRPAATHLSIFITTLKKIRLRSLVAAILFFFDKKEIVHAINVLIRINMLPVQSSILFCCFFFQNNDQFYVLIINK